MEIVQKVIFGEVGTMVLKASKVDKDDNCSMRDRVGMILQLSKEFKIISYIKTI